MTASDSIRIRGARQHNLKGIDVDIPRNALVVVTGLSGSGKSSLAFDTVYAEGQRRYVESLSAYARQFLERLEKPDLDRIEGLSPAIAIEQKTAAHNPRSTVGTVTEIHDYLRLLYARVGIPHCHRCGTPIAAQSLDQMMDQIMALAEGTRFILFSPLPPAGKGAFEKRIRRLRREGFARLRVDGRICDIESVPALDKKAQEPALELVVDRLIVKPGMGNRLADSLELALAQSGGRALVETQGDAEGREAASLFFSEKATCSTCGASYPEFSPASFSFNSPHGACPGCDGLGVTSEFDPALIFPNPRLSLRLGAAAPWAGRNSVQFMEFLEALASHFGADIHTPYESLPERLKEVLLHGSGEMEIPFSFEGKTRRYSLRKPFEGIIPNLRRRYRETDSAKIREEIARFMNFCPCPECGGARLNLASRSVQVAGTAIHELSALTVGAALKFFEGLSLPGRQGVVARTIIKEITDRLGFLEDVGLSYLTLDRSVQSLSGGESQRIRLATQIGSKLTGVLYVLDEPSIGLHQRDNLRLLNTLVQMRDLGNTVLVVEHDEATIRSCDYVIDMGPGAGVNGGRILYAGPPEHLATAEASLTGQYLSGRKQVPVPGARRPGNGKQLRLEGACENNLKDIDIAFPLGTFTCVTGVSGSGKSSLVLETLYPLAAQHLYHSPVRAGRHRRISGLEHIDKVVHIDQSPIGRTPRSNPGTYTGLFSPIRELFARTPDARMRGYKSGRFSFNVKGGRCEACGGDGILRIEMHFLPDVYVTCDVCHGKRYNRETLEIRYKGKTIAEVLDMTINQCLEFFGKIRVVREKLQTLVEVGAGYIKLGQSATTLSGGEAQRIKLARELSKRGTGSTLYILDEPTCGLHMEDVRKLLLVLGQLVDSGNTVVVIEHNLDVIKSADHVIDLGPEGGEAGGGIVGCGTPEAIAALEGSHTGRFLRAGLGLGPL
jgi:excinuclease ABC subunit A